MKEFSFNRMWNVMKYVFLSNWKWYGSLMVSGLMIMTALFCFSGAMADTSAMELVIYNQGLQMMIAGFLLFVVVSSMFHPMVDKRKRISFLSLPAGNAEKFIGLAALTAITLCVMIALTAVPRLVVYFVETGSIIGYEKIGSPSSATAIEEVAPIACAVFVMSMIILVNANKYKNNLIFGGVVAICSFVLTVLVYNYVWALLLDNHADAEGCLDGEALAQVNAAMQLIYWASTIVCVAATALCWWLSFRSFKRAQIQNFLNR